MVQASICHSWDMRTVPILLNDKSLGPDVVQKRVMHPLDDPDESDKASSPRFFPWPHDMHPLDDPDESDKSPSESEIDDQEHTLNSRLTLPRRQAARQVRILSLIGNRKPKNRVRRASVRSAGLRPMLTYLPPPGAERASQPENFSCHSRAGTPRTCRVL